MDLLGLEKGKKNKVNMGNAQINNLEPNQFEMRHIGPREPDVRSMLSELNMNSLEELADQVIPAAIRSQTLSTEVLGSGISEEKMLSLSREVFSKNKVYRSLIGMGYNDCITPSVIMRNVFENPVWYTAYTPYQAEISQGRLEALLNFQTLVTELTGMEIANASLLDEGTACAEAMFMAHAHANHGKKKDINKFLVSPHLHPHNLEVLKTRSEALGFEMMISEPLKHDFSEPVFAVFVQYPNTEGHIEDYRDLTQKAHSHGALMIFASDLMALTLLTPPGEWGADIVVGNSQRFGVPLGFGGPHAAFMATRDQFKRSMPGRLVGVSVDSAGKPAYRLALQTREQHIRREKATSNICTAQVLLANVASMYTVYHGPEGLKKIANKIHELTVLLSVGLKRLGYQKITNGAYFDTLTVTTDKAVATKVINECEKAKINLRVFTSKNPEASELSLGVSMDETCDFQVVQDLWKAFNGGRNPGFTIEEVLKTVKTNAHSHWPQSLIRTSSFLKQKVFNSYQSETEMLRYIHRLQSKDVTLTHSMISLGSCTMKLNATTEMMPLSWPEVSKMHPFAPLKQAEGYLEMIEDLQNKLKAITGFAAVSLQPNAGSQGEYAGLLVIRKYFESKGQKSRNICLIPSSAHGTNPASAAIAGFEVIVVKCDERGNVDIEDLKQKAQLHKDKLACLMITYPSTHGVFEEGIVEICRIIHTEGGQVYMDGANMNALVELCRPGEFGPDVMHLNLHKTFAIPHGGGGPGVGPIGVAAHLAPFLPRHGMVPESGPAAGISSVTSAPWGSASVLPISWSYITLMGAESLRRASLISILNANYIAKKLDGYFPVLYKGRSGFVAHECILDVRDLKRTAGVEVVDIAKRLIDYGFHAPTMSFPVPGTLMVEPTESESKVELDRFIEAMISIRKEIAEIESKQADAEDNVLKNSPHTAEAIVSAQWSHPYSREKAVFPLSHLRENKYWPPVGRIDNAYGDRNLHCTCSG